MPRCSKDNCEVSAWTTWTSCTATCGTSGQQFRERMVQKKRGPAGVGCSFGLKEAQKCSAGVACPTTNCKWGDWGVWGACSCTCGPGYKERTRHRTSSASFP